MSRLRLFAVLAVAFAGLSSQWVNADDDVKQPREAGTKVFGYWEADGFWYPATVLNETAAGVDVRFDDDGTERTLPEGQITNIALEVGQVVEGNFLGQGFYYEGEIGAIDGDNITINYNDGDVETTTVANIRVEPFYTTGFAIGQLVFARWASDGYWYPGQITAINGENYDVQFDDGDTDTVDAKGISYHTVTEGSRVEGNWLAGGLYYPGRITHRRGSAIHIVYDDGDEEDTTLGFVRLVGPPSE